MDIQTTKIELIKMIADIQSEQLLDGLMRFLRQAESKEQVKKVDRLSEQETELLSEINKGIPKDIYNRFLELQTQQKESPLPDKQYKELIQLVDNIEAMEAKRLENMINLSKLWGITLGELRERLDIKIAEPYVW